MCVYVCVCVCVIPLLDQNLGAAIRHFKNLHINGLKKTVMELG